MYSYVEFTIEISRGQQREQGDRVTVRYEKADGGRSAATDTDPLTSSIAGRLPASTAEQRIALGNVLGRCMFPPRVRAAFYQTLGTLAGETGVRVRLVCEDEEMARWPWELARIAIPSRDEPQHVPGEPRYLFRDKRLSLVREVLSERPVTQPKERRKLVILVADATEVPGEHVLAPDFPADLAGSQAVERLPRPTRQSIEEAIGKITSGDDPLDIFHFTGHGRPPRNGQAGTLTVYREGDAGAQDYRSDELARQLARAGTSLAFINACYTGEQAASGEGLGIAQALTGIVPIVVAMRGPVGDRVAKHFAREFYHWLLGGSTVDEAVTRARRALDDSIQEWSDVVLYSRARGGRFLEPVPEATERVAPAPAAAPQPAPDGIRRWAIVGGPQGYWQLVPSELGPHLRWVGSETAADITHLQMTNASLALSADAQVVAQLHRGRLTLAWVDRIVPRLDRWPGSFELPLDEPESRLLAVAVDYGDEVVCLVSTDRATYRVDVSPAEPAVREFIGTPTRCATILAGCTLTVDNEGQLRGLELSVRTHGIREITSLDAARSAGRFRYALAGFDHAGQPVIAQTSAAGTVELRPGPAASEVVVVRPLSRAAAPDQVLVAANGHIERCPMGEAP